MNSRFFAMLIVGIMASILSIVKPDIVNAGSGPFFVVYDHHPENKGDVEVMLMTDYARARVGSDNIAQMLEIEYGVTDQWTTEFMIEGQKTMGDTWLYTGWRWENRYRLFKEELPINPMVYVEWENLNGATKYKMEVSGFKDLEPVENAEAKKEKERILETRLILGKDFGPMTIALNWINESDTRNKWETAYGYALGFSYAFNPIYSERRLKENGGHNHQQHRTNYNVTQWVIGAEMYGGLGDTKSFGIKPDKQEHYIAPVIQMVWHLSNIMLHFNFSPAIGLTSASDKIIFRTSIGVEF